MRSSLKVLLVFFLVIGCEPVDKRPTPQTARIAKTADASPSASTSAASLRRADTPANLPTPMRAGGKVKAPRVTSRVEFVYPAREPEAKYFLRVLVLEAVVHKTGHVRDVKILRGPENADSKVVIDALRRWTFQPGTYEGNPVDVILVLTLNHFPSRETSD